jgi:carboxyl-terminal processing protease
MTRTSFAVSLLACLLNLSSIGKAMAQDQVASRLELVDRATIGSEIYSSIKMHFAHWRSLPNFDLEKEYRAYLQQVLSDDDRHSFDLASIAFVAKLHNGHSGFGDQWLWDSYGQMLPFYAYPIENRWTVIGSEVRGLAPGDVIATIDGEDFEHFYQRNAKYVSASDERWSRRSFFENTYLFPERFALRLEDGRNVTIAREGKHHWAGDEYTHTESNVQPGFVYVRIPSFDKDVFEQEAMDAIQKADPHASVILDVRGNHGGSTPEKLLSALMDRPYRWWAESTPQSISLFDYREYWGKHVEAFWYGDVTQPKATAYKGRVFLLIDGGCFSACEDFVAPFKDNHRAVLIGERTAGSSGQPFGQSLGNGMGLGLGTKREFFPDGSEFEGVGIAPDIEVKLSIEDLRQGKDPALRSAEELSRRPHS